MCLLKAYILGILLNLVKDSAKDSTFSFPRTTLSSKRR
jgi:hypothetical protein